ncbi:MAG: MFS transporter [Halodesulfurarchaeum sp.]
MGGPAPPVEIETPDRGTERWILSWALGSVAFGGASLLVPLYIVQLGASPPQLGVLAATAALVGAPGAMLFGRLATRLEHRRPLVLLTLGTVSAVLAAFPFLRTVLAVIVANSVLWFVVASIAPVVTMLVVADRPESRWSREIGVLNTYQGYGWAGGLVLGTVWPAVGSRFLDAVTVSRWLFWILAAAAGLSALGAARTLPRPGSDGALTNRRRIRRVARLLARSHRGVREATFAFSPNRIYWSTRAVDPRRLVGRVGPVFGTYLLASGLFFAGFATFWAPLPLMLTDAGMGSGTIFGLYLVSSLGSAVLYAGAGRLAETYDPWSLLSGALGVRGLLFPLVALLTVAVPGPDPILLALVLIGIGLTWAVILVVGTTIVSRLSAPSVRAEALGSYTALGALAGGVGSVLGGWIAAFGYGLACAVAGGLVLAGALLVASLGPLSSRHRRPLISRRNP